MINSNSSFANINDSLKTDLDKLNYAKNQCSLQPEKVQQYIKAENKLEGIRIGAMILGTVCLITSIGILCMTFFVSSLPFLISVTALVGLCVIPGIVLWCLFDEKEKPLKKLKQLKSINSDSPLFHYIECVKLGEPDFFKTLGKNNKVDREVKVPNLNGKIINFIKRIFSQKSN